MNHDKHHAELIQSFFKQNKELFSASKQGMYAFLDDDNRVCNTNFAKLLGYASPDEWKRVKVNGSFPGVFVHPKSQRALVTAYQDAMENMIASTFQVKWKKKAGGTVDTTVILIPMIFQGHAIALHFIS